MPPDEGNDGREYKVSTKSLAVLVLTVFLASVLFMVITQWMFLFPRMEQAGEETGGSNEYTSIIQSVYIPEIIFAQILSFACFGFLDITFAIELWKGKIQKSQELIVKVLAHAYIPLRTFSFFVIAMLSIAVLTGTSPRFFMNLHYLMIPIFSVISLGFILYFHRKFFREKTEEETIFKIPDEATF